MTIRELLDRAAMNYEGVTLTPEQVKCVHAVMQWTDAILADLNAENAETLGGNSITSGLDE